MGKDKFLTLDEKDNAMDSLIQSLVFLSQIEQNLFFIKWFIVAFHGALSSFMLLALQKVNSQQIYKSLPRKRKNKKGSKKKEFDPFEGKLLSFLETYRKLKNKENMAGQPFMSSPVHNSAMIELNNKLRNQFTHFIPMIWSAQPWYPAVVCRPLLDVIKFCITFEKIGLTEPEKNTALARIGAIDALLADYAKSTDM